MPNTKGDRLRALWKTTRLIRWAAAVTYALLVYAFPIPIPILQLLAIYTAGVAGTVIVFEALSLARAGPWIPSACVLSLCVLGATWYLAELRLGRSGPVVFRLAPLDAGFFGPRFPSNFSGVPAIELPKADSGRLLLVDPSVPTEVGAPPASDRPEEDLPTVQ